MNTVLVRYGHSVRTKQYKETEGVTDRTPEYNEHFC